MICVDDLVVCLRNAKWKWPQSCHLFSDTYDTDELHAFAAKIGLKRMWFQNNPRLPHYDLTPRKRAEAICHGAKQVTSRELGHLLHERRVSR